MQEGIYQLTYSINGQRRRPNNYIGVVAVGNVTVAFHLRREDDGTFVTRRYDLTPQMKALPAEIRRLQSDDLWHAGVINSCVILEKVELGLEKIVSDIHKDSRQFVQICRQNGAMQRRSYL